MKNLSVKPQTYRVFAIVVISCAYIISFFLPAVVMDRSTGEVVTRPGGAAFMASLVFLRPVWLANPLLWIAVYSIARKKWLQAGALGLLATIMGLTIFHFATVESGPMGGPWTLGGPWTGFGIGYYLWVASMGLSAVLGFVGHWMKKTADFPGKLLW
jgi:hypothetical protein